MNKNTINFIKKYKWKIIILLYIFILAFVLILSYPFLKPKTLIGFLGLKSLKNHLLIHWLGFGIIYIIILYIVINIYKISKINKFFNYKKIYAFLICFFIIMTFIDKYQSKYYYFNNNIGHNNFFGIDYFDDMKSLFKLEIDTIFQKTYTINCDNFYINDKPHRVRGSLTRNYVEYEVNFTNIDSVTNESNTIETSYVAYEDIEYLKKILNSKSKLGFSVTLYKNTKIIKKIELNTEYLSKEI